MQWSKPKVYAVKHKNPDVRMNSRSGGIFTALTDLVLKEKGVVYGCVLTDKFEAIHIRATKPEERDLMRGSKYIQSNLKDTNKSVLKDLEGGKKVLYSGTSCQVSGLLKYLQKDYENLICVDIVCHGVPSPLVWKKYLEWQESKHGKCLAVDFRNKKDFGWARHIETLMVKGKNGEDVKVNSNVFTNLFYGHLIIRPCCYKCPYKSTMHPGDITIADYWGIEKAAPDFNDDKGVSLVLINNERGLKLFDLIKNKIEYVETKIEDSMQPSLIEPFERPANRDLFWNDFKKLSFNKIVNKYGKIKLLQRIKYKIKSII